MIETMPSQEINITSIDLSESFLKLSVQDFNTELRRLRGTEEIRISVDLSNIGEDKKIDFVFLVRRLKAFLESKTSTTQRRVAIVKVRKDQVMWEPNAFSSGVVAEYV